MSTGNCTPAVQPGNTKNRRFWSPVVKEEHILIVFESMVPRDTFSHKKRK
jgi:hypothetical protein